MNLLFWTESCCSFSVLGGLCRCALVSFLIFVIDYKRLIKTNCRGKKNVCVKFGDQCPLYTNC